MCGVDASEQGSRTTFRARTSLQWALSEGDFHMAEEPLQVLVIRLLPEQWPLDMPHSQGFYAMVCVRQAPSTEEGRKNNGLARSRSIASPGRFALGWKDVLHTGL